MKEKKKLHNLRVPRSRGANCPPAHEGRYEQGHGSTATPPSGASPRRPYGLKSTANTPRLVWSKLLFHFYRIYPTYTKFLLDHGVNCKARRLVVQIKCAASQRAWEGKSKVCMPE